MEGEGQWIECVVDSDYEIYTEYPYQIRRKSNKKIIKESIHKPTGYVRCSLNQKQYKKHRLIALQFIPNDDPDNKSFIDHINHIRSDNRIENLRWCSSSENTKNRSSAKGYNYEYIDEIDDKCILIDKYGKHAFENYYYDEKTDIFYFFNGIKYRKLKINYTKYGSAFVCMKDTNNKKTCITYSKFKKQYGLI